MNTEEARAWFASKEPGVRILPDGCDVVAITPKRTVAAKDSGSWETDLTQLNNSGLASELFDLENKNDDSRIRLLLTGGAVVGSSWKAELKDNEWVVRPWD